MPAPILTAHPTTAPRPVNGSTNKRPEIRFWMVLLGLINLGLLVNNTPASNLMFDRAAVASGEWWRILTWPFVHVSRYHLLLDAAAFLLLYSSLSINRSIWRLATVGCCAAGSLLLPLSVAPQIDQLGLCGLSGVAHGLAAISALEMLRQPTNSKLGGFLLAGLLLKTGWELFTGSAFLQQLHLGEIGVPIVTSHAGGVLGGLLGVLLIRTLEGLSHFLRSQR